MKNRLFSGWTKTRKLFFISGVLTILIGVFSREWFFGAVGLYFTFMGLFSFGCAGGSCAFEPISKKTDSTNNFNSNKNHG